MTHIDCYHRLRSALISRRFATTRGGRRVYLFSGGAPLRRGDGELVVRPDLSWEEFDRLPAAQREAAAQAVLARFWSLPEAERLAARLADEDPHEENPWLGFAPMAIALAVEERLGHAHARAVLDSVLQAFAAMFHFSGAFAGYPVRWDPLFSADYKTHYFNNGRRERSAEFALDAAGRYGYANPPSDIRHHHRRTRGMLARLMVNNAPTALNEQEAMLYAHKRAFQQWEVSQDEIFGMVAIAWAIARLCRDAGLRARAGSLLRPLAEYLSRHGYLLVKPQGGLVPRGHGDSLVGAEWALREAFQAACGAPFAAATNWDGAMRAAGYWPMYQKAIQSAGTVLGVPALLLATVQTLLVANLLPQLPAVTPRLVAVLTSAEICDPWAEEARGDLANSLVLHEFDARTRYGLYLDLLHCAPADKAPACNFAPFHSLFGLDRPDPMLRDRYLAWLHPRRQRANMLHPLFALAVGCLLAGDDRYEAELRDRLEATRADLEGRHRGEIPVRPVNHDAAGGRVMLAEDAIAAVDYLGALALAWLHARRRLDAGRSLVAGFPLPPSSFLGWERPRSPRFGDLYPGDVAPRRDGVRPPDVEPAPDTTDTPSVDLSFTVPPSVKEVDTGVDIRYGDVFRIQGAGAVGILGVFSAVGPTGLPSPLPLDPEWPVHVGMDPKARQFALAGRLNGWFMVGGDTGERRWLYKLHPSMGTDTRRLFLRVNQPDPQLVGWSGAFQARVRVWRQPRGWAGLAPDLRAATAQGGGALMGTDAEGRTMALALLASEPYLTPSWFEVRRGRAAPGGTVAVVCRAGGCLDAFVVGRDRRVWHAAASGLAGPVSAGDWGGWWGIDGATFPPGAAVHALASGGELFGIYAADEGGRVVEAAIGNSRAWPPQWQPWQPVMGGLTAPGGAVTAVLGAGAPGSRQDRLPRLFCVGLDGTAYTTAYDSPATGWGGWSRIGTGRFPVGSTLTAISCQPDRLDLYGVDLQGRILTASWGSGAPAWSEWTHVLGGVVPPGSRIAATSRSPGMVDLFTIGPDGRVYTAGLNFAAGSRGGWWFIPGISSRPGTPIEAFSPAPDVLVVVTSTEPDGPVSTWWSNAAGWQGWRPIG